MAEDIFVDGQPLSTSSLNEMSRKLLSLEAAEQKRNATVENTTGTVTYETRMFAVRRNGLKASSKAKPVEVSFEIAKFPTNSTVFYTVTPQWPDDTPNAVYYKIDRSDAKSVTLTYWTDKADITVDFHIIAVALIPKTP
jgi:hypothetical protein